MKVRTYAIVFLSVLALAGCRNRNKEAVPEPEPELPAIGFFQDRFIADTTTVHDSENITSLFHRLGVPGDSTYRLVSLCDTIFDVRKLRAGKQVVAYYPDSARTAPGYIVYVNDRVRSTVFKCRDSLAIWIYDKPVKTERKILDVTIHSSLWSDLAHAGYPAMLIASLESIFEWTVNFFGLQEGDRFRAIYDQKSVDGEPFEISMIHFGLYDSGSTRKAAIRFDQGDGGNKYWDENGESMKKAFLKAPLQFSRISSRFSYARKHPVTGKVRPHTAVDYAAPTGTPVRALGDGTVTLCGWDPTGGGNRIRIKHAGGYETCYMHLSKFGSGIRSGVRVAQGQVIGYVGATGTATGPHLDFRVWKNGTPVDPLKIISPPAEPLKDENLDSLKVLYGKYMEELG